MYVVAAAALGSRNTGSVYGPGGRSSARSQSTWSSLFGCQCAAIEFLRIRKGSNWMRSLCLCRCLWLMLSSGGCQLRVRSSAPILRSSPRFFQGIFFRVGERETNLLLFLSDAISYLAVASYPGGNVCICVASEVGLERGEMG